MANAIEEVDIVGNAADMFNIVDKKYPDKKFDYIISSHNFEHLPDPVKFLQGSGKLLVEGGLLSMAIPDKRFCFDHFRPISTTADVLAAYMEKRERPTAAQIFEQKTMESHLVVDGRFLSGFSSKDNPALIHPSERLMEAFSGWKDSIDQADQPYEDAHCWTFTPASFELILNDLYQTGLSPFTVQYVSDAHENEFFVRLINHTKPASIPLFFEKRKVLLVRMMQECSVAA